jgi:hypothetical protein
MDLSLSSSDGDGGVFLPQQVKSSRVYYAYNTIRKVGRAKGKTVTRRLFGEGREGLWGSCLE